MSSLSPAAGLGSRASRVQTLKKPLTCASGGLGGRRSARRSLSSIAEIRHHGREPLDEGARHRVRTLDRRAALGGPDQAGRFRRRCPIDLDLVLERPSLDDDRPTVLELALGSRTVRLLNDHHLNVVAGIGDTTRGAVLAPKVRPVVAEAVPADDPEVAGVAQRVV